MNYRDDLYKIINTSRDGCSDAVLETFSDEIIKNKAKLPSLYRYVPINKNTIYELETGRLYLAKVSDLNDAFEGLNFTNTYSGKFFGLDRVDVLARMRCFSEEGNSLLMWGVYADSYKGMRIKYDLNRLDESTLRHLFPVCYSKKRSILEVDTDKLIKNAVFVHMKNDIENILADFNVDKLDMLEEIDYDALSSLMPLYLIKPTAWEHEKEWRIISNVFQHGEFKEYLDCIEDTDNRCYQEKLCELKLLDDGCIPFNCVSEVSFGPRADKRYFELFKPIADKYGFECKKTALDAHEYMLKFIKL